MDIDERFEMNEEARMEADFKNIECACGCGRYVNEFDPICIDGELFSDHCASDLVNLRFQGYVEGVSTKTKKLLYNRA